MKLIKKVLPWIITGLIVAYIGLTTNLETVWQTLMAADFVGFIPVVIAVVIVIFLFDSACLTLLFRRFNVPVEFKEILPIKGASYFLNVINYNAAAAGIAYFFRNRKNVPFLESLGSMLWLNFIDIVSLTTLVLIGIGFSGDILDPHLRDVLLWSIAAIYAILVGSCIYWNAGFDFFVLGRFRSWKIFCAFEKATLRDYVLFIGIRTAFVTTYVCSQWFSMPFFNFEAPLIELILYVPVITFVGTIPLTTIAGLGTVQLMMREFFYSFAPGGPDPLDAAAQIDAYSTTTILSFVLCRIIIGYLYMGSVTADMQNHTAQSEDTTESLR